MKVFHTICEQSAFALYNEIVYLEANEKKRLDHDLEIAREIQSILLPSDPPPVPGFEISGLNIPARQVSGDYFDYLVVDDNRTGVAIADVSARGCPPRSSWPCAAASFAARPRSTPLLPKSCTG